MLTFDIGPNRFNIRAAAIILDDGHVLLGTEADVRPLQFVVENFFTMEDGRRFHEIGFYYRATLQDPAYLDKRRTWHGVADGPYRIDLRWFSLDELEQVDLRPQFLGEALRNMREGVQHIVYSTCGETPNQSHA